jgi:hypothetical protein
MPTFMIRDVDHAFITRFSDKAKASGWSPARLAQQLLQDFVDGKIAPSIPPPPRNVGA